MFSLIKSALSYYLSLHFGVNALSSYRAITTSHVPGLDPHFLSRQIVRYSRNIVFGCDFFSLTFPQNLDFLLFLDMTRYFLFSIFSQILCLVAVVSSTRFNGGVLLGPLPLVTSVPIASNPNPHLCASSVCSVLSLASRFCFVFQCESSYPIFQLCSLV